jgi:hypothetical protein
VTPEVVVIAALFLGMGVVALLKPAFIGTFFDVRFGRRPRRGGGAELGTRAMMLLVMALQIRLKLALWWSLSPAAKSDSYEGGHRCLPWR